MKRRTYLASTSSLLTVFAGCSSEDTPNSGAQADTTQTTPTQTPVTTETETETPTTTAAPAEFELGSIQAPETAEIGEKVAYSFTVTNTGEQTGTFQTTVRSRVGNSAWSESEPWRETIEPGQNVRLSSQPFTMEYLSSVDIEITAFDEQFSIRFVGARQDWGEPYTVQDRYKLNAMDIRFSDAYTWTSGDYEYEETPGDGNQWAWVSFRAKNVSNSPKFLPFKTDIALIAGNSQYSAAFARRDEGIYEGGEVQPDIVRNGEILYEVPKGLSQSDLSVAYSETTVNGDITVYWASQ